LEPEYETAARTLLEYGILSAKIDGSKEKEIAEKLRIPGWPSLRVFFLISYLFSFDSQIRLNLISSSFSQITRNV